VSADPHAVEVSFRILSGRNKALVLMRHTGKSRDGLYEPVLAESEREAVADLLQYLENVRTPLLDLIRIKAYTSVAWRNGLLLGRTVESFEHPCVLR
jgi:hypothetical protein